MSHLFSILTNFIIFSRNILFLFIKQKHQKLWMWEGVAIEYLSSCYLSVKKEKVKKNEFFLKHTGNCFI